MILRIVKRFTTNKPPSGVELSSQIFKAAEDVVLTQQQIQKEVENRLKQLELAHRNTQQLVDSKIKFPIKICGTNDKNETRFSYLPDRIMQYYSIPTSRITDYLLKMFKASLYSIADRNQEYMNEYWEEGFKAKALEAIDEARAKNFTIKVQQDSNYMQEIKEQCEIVDSVCLRGLSIDRNQNQDPKQYIKYAEPEEVGLITYTPRYLTHSNQKFIDPKQNKQVYSGYDRMLLRVLVRIKSPLRLNIPEFNIPRDVYTWEHVAVMESQMSPMKPLESSYKLETYMEWLGKFRFGPWRVVDIDNFMLGNSPFRKYEKVEELDPIFKGTKFDKSTHVDIRIV